MANWEKREWNRQQSKQILKKAGILFTEHNNGAHLKIGNIDFWPGTGKWIDPDVSEGRGVHGLISHIKKECAPEQIGLIKALTVDQIFDVAKKTYPLNLYKACENIHAAIYGKVKKENNEMSPAI